MHGYVVFIITSFAAGVESGDQCLLNSKVLFFFSGVIMSIRSFFLFDHTGNLYINTPRGLILYLWRFFSAESPYVHLIVTAFQWKHLTNNIATSKLTTGILKKMIRVLENVTKL